MSENDCEKKGCGGCCGLGCTGLASKLLVLWGVGYALNAAVKAYTLMGFYHPWIAAKFFMHRLGVALAACVVGGVAMHIVRRCKS